MIRHDLQVVLVDFPKKGNEAVAKNEDDSYTIFLNAKLTHEKQLEAYAHALRHIENEDFEKVDVGTIEHEAHQ